MITKQEQKIMELEKANSILKREVKRSKPVCTIKRPIVYSASLMKLHKNKSFSIIRKFNHKVPMFNRNDILLKGELGSGVFGTVKEGFVQSIKQKVAVKIFSEKLGERDILAEAVIATEMSGHPNFAFVFGMSKPNKLLLEFIGTDESAPCLGDVISKNLNFSFWKEVCLDLIHALHELHTRGILHNDLHSRNIMLRNVKHVKIIDFGKATRIDDPVCYSIKPGTPKHAKYNSIHKHLAFELRNIPGSFVSCQTDVYTLGYNFKHVAKYVKSDTLSMIAAEMLSDKPDERPQLSNTLAKVKRL